MGKSLIPLALLLVALVLVVPQAAQAAGQLLWAKHAGGGSFDRAEAVSAYSNGSSVMAGAFGGSATFGEGEQQVVLVAVGTIDAFVAKYDTNGALLWAKQAGDEGIADASGVAAYAGGGAVVTGNFDSTITFDRGLATQTTLTTAGQRDMFVAKLNADGTVAWAKVGGGTQYDYGLAVASLADGGAVVTGYFQGSAIFGEGDNQVTLTSAGAEDIFVAKYAADGSLSWTRSAGGTGGDQGFGVGAYADGSVVISGYFSGTATFDLAEEPVTITSVGANDIFVAKYDSAGSLVWAKRAGGTGTDLAYGAASFTGGGAVISGTFTGTARFGAGETNQTDLISAGDMDAFVAQYNSNGTLAWAKRGGATVADEGLACAAFSDGGAVTTGYYTGCATFGEGDQQVTLTSPGGYNLFVAVYDTTGALLWAKQAVGNGSTSRYGLGAGAFSDGTVVVTGILAGSTTFGEGARQVVLPTGDFLAKYGSVATHTLTVMSNPVSDVAIAGVPDAASGSTSYTAEIEEGTEVTLTAPSSVPGSPTDWHSANWMVGTQVHSNPATFTMTADTTATIYYALDGLKLTYPSAAGVSLEPGQSGVIQWASSGLAKNAKVKIELVQGGATTWTLSAGAANTGSFKWTVGKWSSKTQAVYADGDNYRIRIGTLDGVVTDTSENDFAIGRVASLEITGPTEPVGGSAPQQYTCTAHCDFGPDKDVTALVKWKCLPANYAKMGKTGLLTTKVVAENEQCTLTATYGKGSSAVSAQWFVTVQVDE